MNYASPAPPNAVSVSRHLAEKILIYQVHLFTSAEIPAWNPVTGRITTNLNPHVNNQEVSYDDSNILGALLDPWTYRRR